MSESNLMLFFYQALKSFFVILHGLMSVCTEKGINIVFKFRVKIPQQWDTVWIQKLNHTFVSSVDAHKMLTLHRALSVI